MIDFSNLSQEQIYNWADINDSNNETYIGNDGDDYICDYEDDGFAGSDIFINDMD